MSETVLTSPIILDATGQDMLTKLDSIISAINPVAQGVSYDNAGTGMVANNVQSAITELKTGLVNTNSSLTQYRMVQLNITAQTINPQVGATLLNAVNFTTSTMTDTLSNKTLAQLFSGKTILGVHFMWTNGSGSASVSEYVEDNKVTVGVMNVSSVQLVYSAVRVGIFYR